MKVKSNVEQQQYDERIKYLEDHNDRVLAGVKAEHDRVTADVPVPQAIDVTEWDGKEPKEVAEGIFCMPGDYYVLGDHPFVISAQDFKENYTKI